MLTLEDNPMAYVTVGSDAVRRRNVEVHAVSVIRGTSLWSFPALVAELGGDPDAILRNAGIRRGDAGAFDAFFTYLALIDAVESAAAVTKTPDFGRRLAARQGIEILGPVGVAARTSPNVGAAMAIFEQYLGAYSPAITVHTTTRPDEDVAFFEFVVLIANPPAHPQTIELSLGVALRVFRFLLGPEFAPIAVYFPHSALTSRDDYLRYFSCTPRFAERTAGFTFPAADLQRPLVEDPLTNRAIIDYLDAVTDRRQPGLSVPIRELVRRLLPAGSATLDVIATQFRLHPKTLQRRLATEGTTFNGVVDDVRRELAHKYLRDTDITLTHLTRELGYAEQSVLTRSCRRWFGASPVTLRARWQSGSAAPE